MKKTLVAILALSGMAMAASDLTYTMDTAYTVDGDSGSAVTAILSPFTNPYVEVNQLMHSGFSTTLTIKNMYGSDILPALKDGEKLVLTSIQVVSRANTAARPADAKITLGNNLGTSLNADYSALGTAPNETTTIPRGLITFNFETPVDISNLETLTLTFTGGGKGLGYTCWKGAGDATIESDTPSLANGGWHIPVRLNTQIIPEPATATLSLLTLAGLAARRRRH